MTKMIPALLACFFGAALTAACDPNALGRQPFDVVPPIGAGDDLANPGACFEAETEQACKAALSCVWADNRCSAMDLSAGK